MDGEPDRADDRAPRWGSDVVADAVRWTGVPYVALNPGASFRGLHDSLVNHLGNTRPEILMCLHEEHAVALAHGYAKVTGSPLAVALHSNVGLMHASMAIYNAYCDRMPMLILGATGPLDASARRPWIDWIHTAADQAALVRPFLKWDDQPGSIPAAVESLNRAWHVTTTAPCAPVYVCLDAGLQEQELADDMTPPALLAGPAGTQSPAAESVRDAANALRSARRPVVLAGRTSRDRSDWRRRVALAESLGAAVITDLKAGAAFPTEHPLHVPAPGYFLSRPAIDVLAAADCVLSLDWIDLAGTLRQARQDAPPPEVISASLDSSLHNGWSKDHQALAPVSRWLASTPDVAVRQLLALLPSEPTSPWANSDAAVSDGPSPLHRLARSLRLALDGLSTCLVRVPLGWSGDDWPVRGPLDYLGYDGGGGLGSGPGMTVGAALALRDTGRIPVSVLGDGDYLMGVQALWTAAHHRVPMLLVVANNRSYFNDELHQERVARRRERDVANRWVGQRIDDPAPDLAALARAQGLDGFGPIGGGDALDEVLRQAVKRVLDGHAVVVDAVVDTGYDATMTTSLTR